MTVFILLVDQETHQANVRQTSDRDLIAKYASGDRSAFDALYREYYPRVYGYCFRLLRESGEVDDLVQSIFERALQSMETIRNPDAFYAWLFTIARNEVYGLLRARKTKPRTVPLEVSDEMWEEESMHENYIKKETSDIVIGLIHKLKPEYREVLVLRQYEQLSYAEIAEITGDTVSSVESRLFKARRALAKALTRYLT